MSEPRFRQDLLLVADRDTTHYENLGFWGGKKEEEKGVWWWVVQNPYAINHPIATLRSHKQ